MCCHVDMAITHTSVCGLLCVHTTMLQRLNQSINKCPARSRTSMRMHVAVRAALRHQPSGAALAAPTAGIHDPRTPGILA